MGQTSLSVDIPALGIEGRAVKFPRQVLHPPYKKKTPTSVRLTRSVAGRPSGG